MHQIKRVMLVPLMLVAGDYVVNNMAENGKYSAKSQLIEAGFQVETYLYGLGENIAIQDIYVRHLQDIMEQASGHTA